MTNTVDISGIDRWFLLKELFGYEGSNWKKYFSDKTGILDYGYVYYYRGSPIFARIFSEETLVDPTLYDSFRCPGHFQRVVDEIRNRVRK
jgi:hypothetical protein